MSLVGILFVHKVTEVIEMKDLTVKVHSQSMKKKEVNSLGEINFGKHHFDIGVQFYFTKLWKT